MMVSPPEITNRMSCCCKDDGKSKSVKWEFKLKTSVGEKSEKKITIIIFKMLKETGIMK